MESTTSAPNACLLFHNSKSALSESEIKIPVQVVSHLHIFPKDVKVFYSNPACNPKPEKKRDISFFSNSSCRNLLFVCRNSGEAIRTQITLTYHNDYPTDGKEVKKHLNTFLTNVRTKYRDIKYLWVLEFQGRGAPHFHIFTDREAEDKEFHAFCAKHWNKIVDPENETHLKWHQHKTNYIAWNLKSGKYLAKEYLAKASQKDIPEQYHNVGRFWGNSKNMKPVPVVVDPSTIPDYILTYAIRNTTKRREKILSMFAGCKIRLRGKHRSYSLPLMSSLFCALLEHYGAFAPLSEQVLF